MQVVCNLNILTCIVNQNIWLIFFAIRCKYLPEAGSVAPPSCFWLMLTVQWSNIIMDLDIVDKQNDSIAVCLFVFYC